MKETTKTFTSPMSAYMVKAMDTTEQNFQNLIKSIQPSECKCCCESGPVILPENNAKPVPTIPMIPLDYTSDAIKRIEPYAAENIHLMDILFDRPKVGNTLMDDGTIHTHGIENAAIPGIAIDIDYDTGKLDCSPATVMLTNNAGFRFVGAEPDVATSEGHIMLHDLGQIDVPVVVGDINQPSAVLVPMTNRKAMLDGAEFIETVVDTIDNYSLKSIEVDEI